MGWLKKAVKSVTHAVTSVAGIVGGVVGYATGIGVVTGIAGSLLFNNSSSSSSSNTGALSVVNNDSNIYIPAIDITFEANLLKPNTRLYIYFDGRDLTQYVSNTTPGKASTDPIVTTESGFCSGILHLPNNSSIRFTQGEKEFKLTDSSKNDDTETTYATCTYVYTGDPDNTKTQNLGGTDSFVSGADPTVQSFLILDAGGIYLNSVNLYFLTKDTKYPILFQIREIVDDVVSDYYLTNSNYIIQPSEINTSLDGSIATQINLHAPVFLQQGKEYGIYLVTNAPATYNLATCIYGETDQYNNLSTKDPRIGGLMKHLGNDAWLKDTTRGIKFELAKCAFDTTTKYTLALDNQTLFNKLLDNNSLSTTISTNKITVTDPDHSFNPNDFVTISGLPADTMYSGINSDYINGIHRIDSVTWNTYTFSTVLINNTETPIPTNANASTMFGINVSTDTNYQYDTILLNNNEILLSNTRLDYTIKGLSGQSLDGTEIPNVFDSEFGQITNKTEYSVSRVKKVNSAYNQSALNPGSSKSLQLNIEFSTSNENISPVVEAGNTNVALIENLINNQDDNELLENNGHGIARYITKDISLSAQSNGVQVRFSGNVQANANVKVYYKILPIESTRNLDEESWVEMTIDKDVAKASNDSTFSDYVYTAYDLPLFKAFKTKVLMTSPDSTKPPLIKMYRAIAFQSIDNE